MYRMFILPFDIEQQNFRSKSKRHIKINGRTIDCCLELIYVEYNRPFTLDIKVDTIKRTLSCNVTEFNDKKTLAIYIQKLIFNIYFLRRFDLLYFDLLNYHSKFSKIEDRDVIFVTIEENDIDVKRTTLYELIQNNLMRTFI